MIVDINTLTFDSFIVTTQHPYGKLFVNKA